MKVARTSGATSIWMGALIPKEINSPPPGPAILSVNGRDRKSTRLNSSHGYISYAVFCLKKKKNHKARPRSPRRGTAEVSGPVRPAYHEITDTLAPCQSRRTRLVNTPSKSTYCAARHVR